MTIYDLSQALKRYRRPVAVAFALLFVGVAMMTFTLDGGKPTWRSGLKFESTVQIAVVDPTFDGLGISNATPSDLEGTASLFAQLLTTDEASTWIGQTNGYVLEEPVSTEVARGTSVITASVLAPTADQARAAAVSTFDWLTKKITEPVTTADIPSPPAVTPVISLATPFETFLNITIDPNVASDPSGLFVAVDINGVQVTTVPLDREGTVRTRATLQRVMTLVLTLSNSSDEVLDRIRVAPDPAESPVEVIPELTVVLGPDAIRTRVSADDETVTSIDQDAVTSAWTDGIPPVDDQIAAPEQVGLALLTDVPGFTTSGGRRGPILAVSILIVGSVLILTTIIVIDTWRRQRDAAQRDSIVAAQATNDAEPSLDMNPPATPTQRKRRRRREPDLEATAGDVVEIQTTPVE